MEETGAVSGIFPYSDHLDAEVYTGFFTPGFINCHCHTELSHFKGQIPKHTGLVGFVKEVLSLRQKNWNLKTEKISAGIAEMEKNGIVAVGDICNTTDSIAAKKSSSIYFKNFIEVSGFVPSTAADRFFWGKEIAGKFKVALPQFDASVVPHAPYSTSKQLLELIANEADKILSIHNQETECEDEFIEKAVGNFLSLYQFLGITPQFSPTGKRSLPNWLSVFENKKIISVHNTFTNQSDLDFCQNTNNELWFCLCPNANLYIENRLPQLALFRQNNLNLVLGTDSLASNDVLDIVAEINVLLKNFPTLNINECLQWATLNGAKALGIENRFGSFERGKQPGINLLELDGAELMLKEVVM